MFILTLSDASGMERSYRASSLEIAQGTVIATINGVVIHTELSRLVALSHVEACASYSGACRYAIPDTLLPIAGMSLDGL